MVRGSSDEPRTSVAENPVHVHDFRATILFLRELAPKQLTFRHAGGGYHFPDVQGELVRQILV